MSSYVKFQGGSFKLSLQITRIIENYHFCLEKWAFLGEQNGYI